MVFGSLWNDTTWKLTALNVYVSLILITWRRFTVQESLVITQFKQNTKLYDIAVMTVLHYKVALTRYYCAINYRGANLFSAHSNSYFSRAEIYQNSYDM